MGDERVDEDADGTGVGNSKVVRDEKKERCKFQMSIKFENTDVMAERSSSGLDVSSEEIIGVRKCCGKDQARRLTTLNTTH